MTALAAPPGCRHATPWDAGTAIPIDSIAEALPQSFKAGDTLVCIMAAGVAFRILAPHLVSKLQDPAVIVIDEEGRHVVPLLGGHAAGANHLAREIAAFLGGDAVITTSSDVQGLIAPDELARHLNLAIEDRLALRKITAMLVDGKPLCVESRDDPGVDGYSWVRPGADVSGFAGRVLISHMRDDDMDVPTARLIPRSVVAGVGCRRGTPASEIKSAIKEACDRHGVDYQAVGALASIDVKHDEAGLAETAAFLGAKLYFFSANRLAAMDRRGSDFVAATVGTPAVSEPAALLAAGVGAAIISGKEAFGKVTVALALRASDFPAQVKAGGKTDLPTNVRPGGESEASAPAKPGSESELSAQAKAGGRVMVVGTGAGTAPLLTAAAADALRQADVIMGYRTYVEQIRGLFPGKEFLSGSMGAEIERCREALSLAAGGRTVAMVSSGDPGVYGMAGLVLELAGDVPVTVIPGVTAAQIAAASLGAPLMNDYITLSLSDLLTPREEVLRRAGLAAQSDLVVSIYNPSSRKRRQLFEEVCSLFEDARPADTPVGWVRGAGGPGETRGIIPLSELAGVEIDMRTVIIIGNSRTRLIDGWMVTARGYEKKGEGVN